MLVVLSLVALYAVRRAAHITWRHWGEPEDNRQRAIRSRNQPHFKWKSSVLLHALQAALAWVVSSLVLSAVLNSNLWRWLDSLGGLFGAVADWQLARFKSDPAHKGKVMDAGLMRFSRHPNYFGEFWVCGGALTWWRCLPKAGGGPSLCLSW